MRSIQFVTLLILSFGAFAQGNYPSIHEEQLNYYNATGNTDAAYYEAKPTVQVSHNNKVCNLNKIVYGWHPYWVGSAYQNYQWDLLSHFSFFSYEVNAVDGQPINTHGWSTSAAVDAALASGNTKVTLCVTLFSGHNTFFGSATAQQTLITNLINLVQTRGADGVNIDFEGLPSGQATNFANFMVNLANQMHTAIPGSEVSTVLYAVDWNNVFDFSIMEPEVDHYIIMGYGYYYSGSSTAGPTDPLYHFGSTYNYTLSKTITHYLDVGCPAEKLVLGLPEYGYEWNTANSTIPSSTTASGTAKTYAVIMNNTSGNYSPANYTWVSDPVIDAYVYNDGNDNQCFISLDSAWRKRLEHVLHSGIAGIGIWALGYDNGYNGLWNAMSDYMTDCFEDPCSGIIHDFGGPTRNYYDDEDYTWTIQPPGAGSIDVNFTMFDVELNYDYLYVYDGPTNLSPQIAGSPFTGTTGPGSFTTSSGAVTFRFTSDGATVTPGFLANYSCNAVPAPVADFSLSAMEICVGDSIQLLSNSPNADSYSWTTSAGGLSSSTDENPYFYPLTSGTYTITLDVVNASGSDQMIQNVVISVLDEPVAIGNVLDSTVVIPGEVAYFDNTSVNSTSYYWDFGDGGNSTDMTPWHAYTSNGTYTVTLIAINGVCPNDTTYLTVHVGTQNIISIEGEELTVYPNPAQNELFISGSLSSNAQYQVVAMDGRILDSGELIENSIIDLSQLSKAAYFLRIVTPKAENQLMFIKN